MTGPYIVTTRRGTYTSSHGTVYTTLSRRAVATLDPDLPRIMREHGASSQQIAAAMAVIESGRTVGPLPDGTVIEVEATGWQRLADEADPSQHHESVLVIEAERGNPHAQKRILDTYNARQEAPRMIAPTEAEIVEREAVADRLHELADEITASLALMERAARDRVGPGTAARLRAVALLGADAVNLVHRAAGQHLAGKGPK